MPPYRILIVDQKTENRNKLHTALGAIGVDFQVVSVPSGEEALLEFGSQDFRLLISNTNLPGIDGLAFTKKAKQRCPGLKTILISERNQDPLESEALKAGVDGFFLKDFDRADFLDAVERYLGIVGSTLPAQAEVKSEELDRNLPERLTSLRQELGAIASVLLDEHGNILARAGALPDVSVESSLFPAVMASFGLNRKVPRYLKDTLPNDFLYLSGQDYDLILAHISDEITLLEILNPVESDHDLGDVIEVFFSGVRDLQGILLNIGVNLGGLGELVEEKGEIEDEILEEEPLMDALFQNSQANIPKAEEAAAFWDSLAEEETANGVQNADVLTYDQALQLGLAPEDDNE